MESRRPKKKSKPQRIKLKRIRNKIMKIYLWFNKTNEWKLCDSNDSNFKELLKERNIFISESAKIGNSAEIGYYANIGDFANIGDSAEIGNSAKIGYCAKIGNSAKIGYCAEI